MAFLYLTKYKDGPPIRFYLQSLIWNYDFFFSDDSEENSEEDDDDEEEEEEAEAGEEAKENTEADAASAEPSVSGETEEDEKVKDNESIGKWRKPIGSKLHIIFLSYISKIFYLGRFSAKKTKQNSDLLKVSWIQNEFMRSSFLLKCKPKITRIKNKKNAYIHQKITKKKVLRSLFVW